VEIRGAQTRFVKVASSNAVPGDGVVAGRRRIAARIALVAGAALAVAGLLPAVGALARGAVAPGPFVALGDSYAAGNLIPDSPVGSPGGCLRSSRNYSADAAAALHVGAYIDASCTGAKLVNMMAPESVPFGTDPPQFNALAPDDSVVTITMGGNDIGFASILVTCGLLGVTNPWGDPCQRHYTSGGTDRIAAAIRAEAPRIGAVLQVIRTRAPHARVLVVGYPDILPNTGHGCFPVVPFAHGDVVYLRGVEIAVNQMLASEAAANGASYVDTYTPTIGHDACSPADTKDVEGLFPTSLAYPFHPNQRGQRVMSERVLAALS
jgi:lysophospholipase L1-like esterase